MFTATTVTATTHHNSITLDDYTSQVVESLAKVQLIEHSIRVLEDQISFVKNFIEKHDAALKKDDTDLVAVDVDFEANKEAGKTSGVAQEVDDKANHLSPIVIGGNDGEAGIVTHSVPPFKSRLIADLPAPKSTSMSTLKSTSIPPCWNSISKTKSRPRLDWANLSPSSSRLNPPTLCITIPPQQFYGIRKAVSAQDILSCPGNADAEWEWEWVERGRDFEDVSVNKVGEDHRWYTGVKRKLFVGGGPEVKKRGKVGVVS